MDDPKRQRLLLITALVCFTLLAGDKLIATPLIGYWQARSEDIEKLQLSITKGDSLINRERALRKRWLEMKRDALPEQAPLAEYMVLQAVDRWVNDSRVAILSFKPQWKDQDEKYVRLECRASLQGSIQEITQFLFELERDPLSLKMEDFDLASRDDDGKELTLALVFSGLQFKPEEEEQ